MRLTFLNVFGTNRFHTIPDTCRSTQDDSWDGSLHK